MNETPEELQMALGAYRDRAFAQLFLVTVDLVARTHPDLLREALGAAFDLKEYERQARRIRDTVNAVASEANTRLMEYRHRLEELEKIRNSIHKELLALRYEIDEIQRGVMS